MGHPTGLVVMALKPGLRGGSRCEMLIRKRNPQALA